MGKASGAIPNVSRALGLIFGGFVSFACLGLCYTCVVLVLTPPLTNTSSGHHIKGNGYSIDLNLAWSE